MATKSLTVCWIQTLSLVCTNKLVWGLILYIGKALNCEGAYYWKTIEISRDLFTSVHPSLWEVDHQSSDSLCYAKSVEPIKYRKRS